MMAVVIGARSSLPYALGAVGMSAVALGGCDYFERDSCLDDGGVWDADLEECFCSRSQQGTYADEESPEQRAWRDWCAGLSTLETIKNKAAVTSAPAGD
ncbi:MAG: hypothetical protein V2I43_06025 [Parvularcula sp.]|jgi:hypothetical protein|nr:hypothetical protein [Parvularcula sp.]